MRAAVVLSLALLGCGDREAAQLEKVKAAVCTCKTASCAEAALKELPQDHIKSSHKAQRYARDMLDCLSKLYEAERPTTDPDATSPETSGSASARTP